MWPRESVLSVNNSYTNMKIMWLPAMRLLKVIDFHYALCLANQHDGCAFRGKVMISSVKMVINWCLHLEVFSTLPYSYLCVSCKLCTYGMQASMLGIFTFYSVSKDKSANLGNTWFQLLLLRVSANEYEDWRDNQFSKQYTSKAEAPISSRHRHQDSINTNVLTSRVKILQ